MTEVATMVCFHCGREEQVSMTEPIQFGIDVANAATAVGMISRFDLHRGRVLVFCNDECAAAHITRYGVYKMRPGKKKIVSEEKGEPS